MIWKCPYNAGRYVQCPDGVVSRVWGNWYVVPHRRWSYQQQMFGIIVIFLHIAAEYEITGVETHNVSHNGTGMCWYSFREYGVIILPPIYIQFNVSNVFWNIN